MRILLNPFFPIALTATFLVGCGGGDVPTEQPSADTTATSTAAFPTGRIALKAANDKFIVCDLEAAEGMQGSLKAGRDQVGAWETFEVVDLGNGRIALKAVNGKFVCADRGLGNVLVANRDSISDWETFEVRMMADDQLTLRTTEGKYITADLAAEGERNGLLIADRDEAKEWETFRVQRDIPLPAAQ